RRSSDLPDQGYIAAVGRHRGNFECLVVLEHQRTLVPLDRVAVEIEAGRVALVGQRVKRLPILGPAREQRLYFIPGREVARLARCFPDEQVVDLVTTLVSRKEDPFVVGKPGNGEYGIRRGRGERLLRPVGSRQCDRVEDAGLVRGDEKPAVVRGPCIAAREREGGGGEERLCVILCRLA